MEIDLKARYNELWRSAHSAEKIAAIKECMRYADQIGDEEYALLFREALFDECIYYKTYSDDRDAIAAFGYIVGHCARNKLDLGYDQLEDYQWCLRWMMVYPEIGLAQLDSALADFRQRLSLITDKIRTYHEALLISSIYTDRGKTAEEAYSLYFGKAKDNFVRCDACITSRCIKFHRYMGDHKAALKAAEIYKKKGVVCNQNPTVAYNDLVASAVENGELDGIEEMQAKVYKEVSGNSFNLGEMGWHIQYYLYTDPKKAFACYKKHVHWSLLFIRHPLGHFEFHLGAARLMKNFGRASFKAQFVRELPFYNTQNTYKTKELMEYHYKKAEEIAGAFDKRNGTSYFQDKLKRLFDLPV